ncbi:MAG: hypothetical protein D4R64_15705 [Porphyromonadaceae bacterium]|nr:MAG: hypothetical protein D4R64_15705 [Porphyromonadaceae bacterium]
MKNNFIYAPLTILALLVMFPACAQKKDVPEAVKKAFVSRFAEAKSIKWSSESVTEFEAEFKLNGNEMSANFDPQGTWMETESELTASDLPPTVLKSIQTDFNGFKIKEIAKIETPDQGISFEVAIKKAKEQFELVLDGSGKLLKKVDLNKEEEGEEK